MGSLGRKMKRTNHHETSKKVLAANRLRVRQEAEIRQWHDVGTFMAKIQKDLNSIPLQEFYLENEDGLSENEKMLIIQALRDTNEYTKKTHFDTIQTTASGGQSHGSGESPSAGAGEIPP